MPSLCILQGTVFTFNRTNFSLHNCQGSLSSTNAFLRKLSKAYPYPEERLIDGVIGATEDTPLFVTTDALEAALDFDAAQPLIYPQELVLFQEDDEYYKSTRGYNGFWNNFLNAIDGSYCAYSAFGETGNCTVKECLFYPRNLLLAEE